MRLNHYEIESLFTDLQLVNGIAECRTIVKDYLINKGYQVTVNYTVKGSDDVIDIAAVKDNHSMAVMIGRKYPRKRRIASLMKITKADNRVFLTREATHQYRLMGNVEVIDCLMAERLTKRSNIMDDDYVPDMERKTVKENKKPVDMKWLDILEGRA